MRPHASVVIACICLLGLLTPAPAYAIWGKGWLERLSGPGPFWGTQYHHRFVCISGTPEPQHSKEVELKLATHETLSDLRIHLGANAYVSPAGCNYLGRDQPRLEIGLQVARMESTNNVLDYSHREPPADTAVNLRMVMMTLDFRVNRVLDVGASVGRASFSARSDDRLFDSFPRLVTHPVRFTMRPLAAVSDREILEALTLRVDATRFHGGFTAEHFGARPGTFNEPGEMLWSWSAVVDLGAVLWR